MVFWIPNSFLLDNGLGWSQPWRMIRGLTRILLLLTFVAFADLATADDCDALRSVFEKWVAAYANHDLAGTMAIFADDVNFSFQGSPDAKKADLEKGYRAEF